MLKMNKNIWLSLLSIGLGLVIGATSFMLASCAGAALMYIKGVSDITLFKVFGVLYTIAVTALSTIGAWKIYRE